MKWLMISGMVLSLMPPAGAELITPDSVGVVGIPADLPSCKFLEFMRSGADEELFWLQKGVSLRPSSENSFRDYQDFFSVNSLKAFIGTPTYRIRVKIEDLPTLRILDQRQAMQIETSGRVLRVSGKGEAREGGFRLEETPGSARMSFPVTLEEYCLSDAFTWVIYSGCPLQPGTGSGLGPGSEDQDLEKCRRRTELEIDLRHGRGDQQ
jgi:hypothetical protein